MNTLRPQTVQALFYNHNFSIIIISLRIIFMSIQVQNINSAPFHIQINSLHLTNAPTPKKKKTVLWSIKDHRDGVNRHAHHARSCQDQISKDESAIVLQNRILFESGSVKPKPYLPTSNSISRPVASGRGGCSGGGGARRREFLGPGGLHLKAQ
jgi:hypothetical protein